MRHEGTLYNGTVPGAGSGVRDALFARLLAAITNWDPGVPGMGWTVYHTFSATDVVLLSLGDPNSTDGDFTRIFLRLRRNGNNILATLFSDFSTLSGTGSRESSASPLLAIASDTEACPFFVRVGSHEIAILIKQASDTFGFKIMSIASATRDLVPPHMRGTAMCSPVSSGSNVVLPLDRDLRKRIQVGQRVWIVHQTTPGAALVSDVVQIATVSAVGESTITVATLATTIGGLGALVGLQPQPGMVACNTGTNTESYATGAWNPRFYLLHRVDGTFNATSRAALNTTPEGWIPESATPADISFYGHVPVKPIYLNNTDGLSSHPIVGGPRFLALAQADTHNAVRAEGDLIYANGNASAPWLVTAPRLRSTTGSRHWNWALRYSAPVAA